MKNLIVVLFVLVSTTLFAQVGYVNGSNFGDFLKASCVYNQVDGLIEHTAQESIDLHGKDKLKEFYKSIELSKQETWDFVTTDGSDTEVSQHYTRSLQGAYSREITLNLVKENGAWKIVLPKDLNKFLK